MYEEFVTRGKITFEEFVGLCNNLFEEGSFDQTKLRDIFETFDTNRDDLIDESDFQHWQQSWLLKVLHPRSALIVVDVQNDFIDGTLTVENARDIIEPINRLVAHVPFEVIVYSLDWHPPNHISFIDNVHARPFDPVSPVTASAAKTFDTVVFKGGIEQCLWPRHCVQNEHGSRLHDELQVHVDAKRIHKGTNPAIDSYSAFWDNGRRAQTPLDAYLKDANISDIYVCGLAYDVCVGATALDGINAGYRTVLINDCSRGISNDNVAKTNRSLEEKHGMIADSKEVHEMVSGKRRSFELAYALSLQR